MCVCIYTSGLNIAKNTYIVKYLDPCQTSMRDFSSDIWGLLAQLGPGFSKFLTT